MHDFHDVGVSPNYYDCGFAKYTQKVLNDGEVKRLRVDYVSSEHSTRED